jgi:hypothetical protein
MGTEPLASTGPCSGPLDDSSGAIPSGALVCEKAETRVHSVNKPKQAQVPGGIVLRLLFAVGTW